MKGNITWTPEMYDAIKAKADEVGGVGSGEFYREGNCPWCVVGIAVDAGVLTIPEEDKVTFLYSDEGINTMRETLGLSFCESDRAVRSIVGVLGERAPFDQWAKAAGVTKG